MAESVAARVDRRGGRGKRREYTLDQAFREFVRHPSPWMIFAGFVVAIAWRLGEGDWQWTDAAVPVVMVALFPVFEWVVHVCVLHWRPRRIGSRTVDSELARKHRDHHADPRNVGLIFIPPRSLALVLVGLLVIGLLAFPRLGLGLTFLLTFSVLGMAYEWTHFLIHTDYKPRHALYRAVWKNHRHHHYKNEHYWFTVTTSGTADRAFQTYPDPGSVATSPTAKNLHATAR